LKLVVVTWGISHFEVPLFRLLAAHPDIDLKVYYFLDPDENKVFDQSYQQGIDWGENMLGGYHSERVRDCMEAFRRVEEWQADAVMIYGYSWPGALRFLLKCRMARIPLVFRGTLNYYKDPRFSLLQRLRRPFRAPVFHLFDSLQYGGTYSQRVLRRHRPTRRVDHRPEVGAISDRRRATGARVWRSRASSSKGPRRWQRRVRCQTYPGR